MGLFDNFKLMGDIIKEGIASSKQWDKLTGLLEKAVAEHQNVFSPQQKALYSQYIQAKEKAEKLLGGKDTEAYNQANNEREAAELAFMKNLSESARVPQDLKDQILEVLTELGKEDEHAEKIFRDHMLKRARNDKERQEMLDAFAEEDAKKNKK